MKVTAATGSFVDLEIKKMIRNSLERLSRHDLDNRITRGEACRGTGMLVSHAAGRLELNPMRMDPAADHGALNGLARHRVNVELIARNWDDLLRVAGSLARGTIGASELIGTLLRSSRPSTLTRVIGELGRVAKTLYLLSYLDDETYRRRILRQLNRGESRHGVARAIFHGPCIGRRSGLGTSCRVPRAPAATEDARKFSGFSKFWLFPRPLQGSIEASIRRIHKPLTQRQ